MKTERWMIHSIFTCQDCGESWEDYLTAELNAENHAKKLKHKVTGEIGKAVSYDGKNT